MWVTVGLSALVVAGCDACAAVVPFDGTPTVEPVRAGDRSIVIDLAGTGWGPVGRCPDQVRVVDGSRTIYDGRITTANGGPRGECRVTGETRIAVPYVTEGQPRRVTLLVELLANYDEVQPLGEDFFSIRAGKEIAFDIGAAPTGAENRPPTAAFTVSPPRPTAGRDVTLDASNSGDPDGAIATWTWDLDSDGTYETRSEGPRLPTRFAGSGPHVVGLRVTDDRGAEATARQTVDVKEPSGPDVAFAWAPNPPEMNEETTFDAGFTTDPDGDALETYLWDFGDGTDPVTTRSKQVTHRFESTGRFAVELTVTDSSGMAGSYTNEIEVVPASERRARAAARPRALVAPYQLDVEGRLLSAGRTTTAGTRVDVRRALAGGTASGSLPARLAPRAPAGLRSFRSLRWVGRFSANGDLATLRDLRGSGILLAASTVSPRTTVCLRVRGGVDKGRFRVLGGTRSMRRLRARGGFGTQDLLVARTGRPRGLPRRCRTLRPALRRQTDS